MKSHQPKPKSKDLHWKVILCVLVVFSLSALIIAEPVGNFLIGNFSNAVAEFIGIDKLCSDQGKAGVVKLEHCHPKP